ncbi:unnamed protein product [Allacma fusca]|uniref:Uncharacterized protein n=1 Tax=Allacma fusca TaxID=39272 RepID=A0A8J2LA11_9HEXA|nr:unnamed protein product [Allacma fusca]
MKVTKPGGQKFRNFAQNAVKLQVPITPIRVSLDGTLDLKASECVVLKKEELEEFCKKKKSAKEDVNLEEWRWILCSRRT